MTADAVAFGIGYAASQPAAQVVETARVAERLGFDTFWLTDSHLASREALTLLGAIAISTERLIIGTGVSHLVGRHPSVLASSFATLDELAPGRVRLGMGVGDTGAANMGVPRAKLQELETAVRDIRALMAGEEVDGPGRRIRLAWVTTPHRVPIYLAGSSERSQQLMGRVADGALISSVPEQLPVSIERVRAGEQAAGRPAGATRIMLWSTACVDEDREVARATVRGSVAKRAMNTFTRLARQGQLSAEDVEALERLQREHERAYRDDVHYEQIVPERWIDTLAIAGTPQDVRARLERGIEQGATEVSMILLSPRSGARGAHDQLERFANDVIAPLRRATVSA
jgi:5,10-methylenetetrahydromethanopterin reductase